MSIKNTGLNSRDLNGAFFERFNARDKTALYQRLATRIPSTKDSENYRWLGSVPNLREWGSGRVAKGLRAESYSVANQKYEATLDVDQDEIDDDQTGQIRIRVQELAQRAATHKDYLIAQLIINGATSGFNSYDGVSFFNDAHESGASGQQDNDLTFNCTDHTVPTSVELRNAVRQAIAAMAAFKDDQGEPLVLDMANLAVVVPPGLYFPMKEAIGAAMLNNTSNVDVGLADVVMMPWLTDAAKFQVFKTDGVVRPFIFQDRAPIKPSSEAEGSSQEFHREIYSYGVRARYRLTYGMWQYAVQTTLN